MKLNKTGILLFSMLGTLCFVSSTEKEKKEVDAAKIFSALKASETGIRFSNDLTENDSLNYFTYSYLYMGGGVATGDIDNDGDLDLYLANYPPTKFNSPTFVYTNKIKHVTDEQTDHLYRNDGETFTDVTAEAGLRAFGLSLSATVGDLNNDSWPDLCVERLQFPRSALPQPRRRRF